MRWRNLATSMSATCTTARNSRRAGPRSAPRRRDRMLAGRIPWPWSGESSAPGRRTGYPQDDGNARRDAEAPVECDPRYLVRLIYVVFVPINSDYTRSLVVAAGPRAALTVSKAADSQAGMNQIC